jgi:hypothetical protein
MREYTTIIDTDGEHGVPESIYLCPIGTAKPEHFILCQNAQDAHSLKLSLGLGTQPDPSKMPHYYQKLEQDFNGAPVFRVVKLEDIDDSWSDPGCCESGCNGCPWTLKNLGTI